MDQNDEDEQVYAAPFEDESLEEHENDESLAATQEAIEAEREQRDAALDGAGAKIADAYDEREKLRESVGGDLAWWAEDDGVPVIDIASEVANHTCGYVGHLRALARHGLPLDAMPAQITLTHLSGPVVVAGLQVLGTLHPHLRDDIAEIISEINLATPVATSEEEEAYDIAHRALAQEQMADMRKQFEAQGIPVVSLEEMFGGADPNEQDASLN